MNTVGKQPGRGQMMWISHGNYMKASMAAHGDKELANRNWNALLQNPLYAKKESELGNIVILMLVSSKRILPM